MTIYDLNLLPDDGYPVEYSSSKGGGFGSNAYYAQVVNGVTYIYEYVSGEVVQIIP